MVETKKMNLFGNGIWVKFRYTGSLENNAHILKGNNRLIC